MIRRLLLATLLSTAFSVHAVQSCGSRLFVSGWFSTVHVFDACTGQYLRDLDTRARLSGAMAVRLGPDGFIYAVSENGGAIHKYRNDTLEYVGAFVQAPGIGPTGLAFDTACAPMLLGRVLLEAVCDGLPDAQARLEEFDAKAAAQGLFVE